MSNWQLSAMLAVAVAIRAVCPATAYAHSATPVEYLSVVASMVAEEGPRSALASAAIRDAYQPYVDSLIVDDFDGIETALATGGLVRLPIDWQRFNVRVRLAGTNPIAEKDVLRQTSYVSARAATIGCLLDVASRVKSGPIEVTSLVRHLEYQHQLRMTNANAATDIPTHALGLAFDIAMVNTPLQTVLEIRDVLRQMSDAGAILVIVERQQLVFHVVPQPTRLGWYSDVYAHAITGRPWLRVVDEHSALTPIVTTEIGSLQPLPAWAAEWWAAENVPIDLPISVHADGGAPVSDSRGRIGRYIAWIGEFLSSRWQRNSPWATG